MGSALESGRDEYLAFLAVERGSSPRTVESYGHDLADYLAFLESAEVVEPEEVTRDTISAYTADLLERGMAPATIERHLSAVKGFHRFMVREGITSNHPTAHVALPKTPSHLPDVLTIDEADRLLSQPFPDGAVGLRDRAVLELLYGCGLRVSELCGLDLSELFLDDGLIRVRGKEQDVRFFGRRLPYLNGLREFSRRIETDFRDFQQCGGIKGFQPHRI